MHRQTPMARSTLIRLKTRAVLAAREDADRKFFNDMKNGFLAVLAIAVFIALTIWLLSPAAAEASPVGISHHIPVHHMLPAWISVFSALALGVALTTYIVRSTLLAAGLFDGKNIQRDRI